MASWRFLFTGSLLLLLVLGGGVGCLGLAVFSFDIHHRFSEPLKGLAAGRAGFGHWEWPEKGSVDYFAALAHHDRVVRGRGLAGRGEDGPPLTFSDGNETIKIASLGLYVVSYNISLLIALDLVFWFWFLFFLIDVGLFTIYVESSTRCLIFLLFLHLLMSCSFCPRFGLVMIHGGCWFSAFFFCSCRWGYSACTIVWCRWGRPTWLFWWRLILGVTCFGCRVTVSAVRRPLQLVMGLYAISLFFASLSLDSFLVFYDCCCCFCKLTTSACDLFFPPEQQSSCFVAIKFRLL